MKSEGGEKKRKKENTANDFPFSRDDYAAVRGKRYKEAVGQICNAMP